jgi:hypothetical protein
VAQVDGTDEDNGRKRTHDKHLSAASQRLAFLLL